MKRILMAAALLAFASSAQAGDGPLAQMHFFEGCWRGQFAASGAGAGVGAVTDDRCFEAMQGGTYVRDTHVVRGAPGPYSGEAIYYLDAQAHKLAVIYFSSDGGVERGFAEPDGHGGLTFPPGIYVDADGSTLTMRATWRTDGPDRYIAIAEAQDNGQWREHLRILYTRAPDLHPGDLAPAPAQH